MPTIRLRWPDVKPRKPLRRSSKPIKRRARIRSRKADPTKRRFADRRDETYAAWIREQPCILESNPRSFGCSGRIEACHVRARSVGGDDLGNLYPGCTRHHRCQHLWGIKTFASFFDVDLQRLALKYGAQYRKAA